MNRMKKNAAAVLLMTALMAIAPMNAMAAETTALAAGAQGEPTSQGEMVDYRALLKDYLGVTVSSEWMLQARINGVLINMRLFTPAGESVTFKEGLSAAEGKNSICLTMCASSWNEELVLQMDQRAMNVLNRVGITKIVVTDDHYAVRAKYDVEELQMIRDHFGLTRNEQLCVSGEENPVTVIGEDGFRRQITQ